MMTIMTIVKMLSRKTMELFVSIIALDQKSTWRWVKMILMELMMMVIEEGECGGEDDDDDYYGDCGGDGADDDQNCFMWRTMVSAPPLCVAP